MKYSVCWFAKKSKIACDSTDLQLIPYVARYDEYVERFFLAGYYLLNSTVAAKSSLQFENNLLLDPDCGGRTKQL
jgi:hypothetical protein